MPSRAPVAGRSSRYEEEKQRALTELQDKLLYEKGSSDFHADEQGRSAAALQRAGCEIRILTKTIAHLDDEIATLALLPPTATPGVPAPPAAAAPAAARPSKAAAPATAAKGRPPLPKKPAPTRGRT